jgi:hypothetical protein
MPPECFVATKPAGAAPRPASRRLMIAPLSGRGEYRIREVWEAGITLSAQREPICELLSATAISPASPIVRDQESSGLVSQGLGRNIRGAKFAE